MKLIEAIQANTEDDVDNHKNWKPIVPLQYIKEEIERVIGEAELHQFQNYAKREMFDLV